MTFTALMTRAVERLPLPDGVTLAGISHLVGRTGLRMDATGGRNQFLCAQAMMRHAIAEHTADANAQHYEIPAEFFRVVLGPRRKYSCCLYENGAENLAAAEEVALAATAQHAGLADGQDILELGCGWGSLTLWMGEHFPKSKITAVSNSLSQRKHIMGEAQRRGLSNVTVHTIDMNDFRAEGCFDRVVSVEMFEHMSNWQTLLERVRGWLKDDGRLFLHVFTHRTASYRFDHSDKADWIAQHFFTGGIMPSHTLIRKFDRLFSVEEEWRWNGRHYERTALDWLANFDDNLPEIDRILASVYGADARLWRRRWRLFFLATAGLFGQGGRERWGVSHYRLRTAR